MTEDNWTRRKTNVEEERDWIFVKYVEDDILHCLRWTISNEKLIPGSRRKFKYKDGKNYDGVVLMTGTKCDIKEALRKKDLPGEIEVKRSGNREDTISSATSESVISQSSKEEGSNVINESQETEVKNNHFPNESIILECTDHGTSNEGVAKSTDIEGTPTLFVNEENHKPCTQISNEKESIDYCGKGGTEKKMDHIPNESNILGCIDNGNANECVAKCTSLEDRPPSFVNEENHKQCTQFSNEKESIDFCGKGGTEKKMDHIPNESNILGCIDNGNANECVAKCTSLEDIPRSFVNEENHKPCTQFSNEKESIDFCGKGGTEKKMDHISNESNILGCIDNGNANECVDKCTSLEDIPPSFVNEENHKQCTQFSNEKESMDYCEKGGAEKKMDHIPNEPNILGCIDNGNANECIAKCTGFEDIPTSIDNKESNKLCTYFFSDEASSQSYESEETGINEFLERKRNVVQCTVWAKTNGSVVRAGAFCEDIPTSINVEERNIFCTQFLKEKSGHENYNPQKIEKSKEHFQFEGNIIHSQAHCSTNNGTVDTLYFRENSQTVTSEPIHQCLIQSSKGKRNTKNDQSVKLQEHTYHFQSKYNVKQSVVNCDSESIDIPFNEYNRKFEINKSEGSNYKIKLVDYSDSSSSNSDRLNDMNTMNLKYSTERSILRHFSDDECSFHDLSLDDSLEDPHYVPKDTQSSSSDSNFELSNVNLRKRKYKNISYSYTSYNFTPNTTLEKDHTQNKDIVGYCSYSDSYSESGVESHSPEKNPMLNCGVRVSTTSNKPTLRVWDRKDCCIFCQKMVTKLSSHLIAKHKDERDVAMFQCLAKGSQERKNILKKIRNAGNYEHNVRVLEESKGEIIPCKRPKFDVSPRKYVACRGCLGYYLQRELWRHLRKCDASRERNEQAKELTLAKMLLPFPTTCQSGLLENVISKMKDDEITLIARNDKLIIAYASKKYQVHGHEKHLHAYVSQKIRELARFLKEARSIDKSVHTLQDCICVNAFSTVVQTVKTICGFHEDTHRYEKPSLALKLGQALKYCASILISLALKSNDDNLRKQAEKFQQLHNMEWKNEISTHALTTISRRKWRNPELLPIAEDMQKLRKYLHGEIEVCKIKLQENPDKAVWEELCQLSLTSIILFNRRRSGEAQRMELEDFQNNKCADCSKEVVETLSTFEQHLINSLTLVYIRGKKGRKVPVLLTEETKSCIDLLISTRKVVDIAENNKYVFARARHSSLECFRGHDVLRRYSLKCGATHPELITSTKLRKHIATMTQILDMKKSEMESMASYMGHDLDVHKNYYRLPESAIILAKTSKIFMAADSGKLSNFLGKTLDDIELDKMSDNESTASDPSATQENEYTVNTPNNTQLLSDTSNISVGTINNNQSQSKSKSVRKRKCVKRQNWSTQESSCVRKYLSKFIALKRVPGKHDCEQCIKHSGSILKNRTWTQVKFFVYNDIKKM